jgi:hypothetical protein
MLEEICVGWQASGERFPGGGRACGSCEGRACLPSCGQALRHDPRRLYYPPGFLHLWRLRLRDALGQTLAAPIRAAAAGSVRTVRITLVRFRETSETLECVLGGVDPDIQTHGRGMPFFVRGPAPRGKILRMRSADVQVLLERRGDSAIVGVAVYPGSRRAGGVLEEQVDWTPCLGSD